MADPYRVGVLGAGYISDWHCQALAHLPNARLEAVADLSHSRAQALAESYSAPRVHGSLEEMLEAGGLDAVHVLLPPSTHLEASTKVLKAGVHCFVEKPMCVSSSEADQLAAAAEEHQAALGVNHNFLFLPAYEALRRDLNNGELGRVDSVTITWNKPLPQLWHGPFDIWMLREPGNLLMEIGPHSASQLLDLLGTPNSVSCQAGRELPLPRGKKAYRHWSAVADYESTVARLEFSFDKGPNEHIIRVRGSHGLAVVDLENNTYTLDRSTKYGIDFDRYHRLRRVSKGLAGQARRNLLSYLGSKAKLSKNGNSYGTSIRRAVEAFYRGLDVGLESGSDPRLSCRLGGEAVGLCERMASSAKLPEAPVAQRRQPVGVAVGSNGVADQSDWQSHSLESAPSDPGDESSSSGGEKPILVIGGTGFIGRHLTRALLERGRRVRLLVRSEANVPDDLLGPRLEVCRGTMTSSDDLDRVMDGVDCVFHLARPMVNKWEDYVRLDIEPSVLIAEKCLEHGVRRLIYTGTIDSYYAGKKAGVIVEQTGNDKAIKGRNYYAQSKAEIEQRLERLQRERGLPLVIMRPGIVIGRGGSPFHWGVGMWSGESYCRVWGDGNNPLPLVLVEDVADALVAGIEAEAIDGESFNLVADPALSANEYLAALAETSGVRIDADPTSIGSFYRSDMLKWLVKIAVRHHDRKRPTYRDWESRTQSATFDCTKAKDLLGWRPRSDPDDLVSHGIAAPVAEAFA